MYKEPAHRSKKGLLLLLSLLWLGGCQSDDSGSPIISQAKKTPTPASGSSSLPTAAPQLTPTPAGFNPAGTVELASRSVGATRRPDEFISYKATPTPSPSGKPLVSGTPLVLGTPPPGMAVGGGGGGSGAGGGPGSGSPGGSGTPGSGTGGFFNTPGPATASATPGTP